MAGSVLPRERPALGKGARLARDDGGVLADVIDYLRCPVCRAPPALVAGAVRCDMGHSFDVARQGYVSLLTGSGVPGTADTAAMVAARADFLTSGHYAPLAARLAAHCPAAAVIADAGAGTGYYLGQVLRVISQISQEAEAEEPGAGPPERSEPSERHERSKRSVGIALDVSKHALKRAARAHPRIGAVVTDIWQPLPIRDESVDVLLNVFAPRNADEFARILKPDGMLLVVTPTTGHLSPLVERLGLLSVDEDKELRLERTLGGRFARAVQDVEEITLELGHKEVEAVVGMGPSAWHTDPGALAESIRALPDPVRVRAAFRITGWIRRL